MRPRNQRSRDSRPEAGQNETGTRKSDPKPQIVPPPPPPAAFGAGTVGGAVAAAAIAGPNRTYAHDAREEDTVAAGDGAVEERPRRSPRRR